MEAAKLVALCAGTVGQVLFLSLYARRRWWVHFIGRSLFTHAAALTLVLVVATAYLIEPGLPGETPVKVGAFWAMTAGIWWQTIALIWQGRTEPHPRPYQHPDRPESWYWIEYRPSGHYDHTPPPAPGWWWLVVNNDHELRWFETARDAAHHVTALVQLDTAALNERRHHG